MKKLPPKKKGGYRKNSGRKPDWLKQSCQRIIDKHQLLNFLARVAAGEEKERQVIDRGGVVTRTVSDASLSDRLRAAEMLMDRGFGRPPQSMEVSGGLTHDFAILEAARERAGLRIPTPSGHGGNGS